MILLNLDPTGVIAYMEKRGYTSLYLDGGKTIQGFLKEDLIDRMVITRVPILLGSGIPLFGFLDRDLQFRHVETKVFANGLVRSNYERIRT